MSPPDHCEHFHCTSHAQGKPAYKVLIFAILITFAFALVEAVGGYLSHSLTLMSDAGHMTLDSIALGIASFGAWLAIKPPSSKHTYGFGRAEVIAAWISSLLMVLLSIGIIFEAIERFRTPHTVSGLPVMIIAVIGLLANLLIAKLLHGTEKTLNVKAALLHVIGDLLGSVAALLSGIIIYFSHWNPIDPILSIFISLLILYSSIKLLIQSLSVLMEKVPSHLTIEIENWICTLQAITALLKKEYQIEHITLQPELRDKNKSPCHCTFNVSE